MTFSAAINPLSSPGGQRSRRRRRAFWKKSRQSSRLRGITDSVGSNEKCSDYICITSNEPNVVTAERQTVASKLTVKPWAASQSRPTRCSRPMLYQEFPFISTNGSTCLTSSFPFHPATLLLPSRLRKDHLTLFWGGEVIIGGETSSCLCALIAEPQSPKAFDGTRRDTLRHPHTNTRSYILYCLHFSLKTWDPDCGSWLMTASHSQL